MTRLKGKVISRSLNDLLQKGSQVLYDGVIYPFVSINTTGVYVSTTKEGAQWRRVAHPSDFMELCVQYRLCKVPASMYEIVVVPLKYNQWQAAIDNGEVDSDKEVEFELSQFNLPNGNSATGLANTVTLAKIIPAKKERLYTIKQVKSISREAYYKGRLDEIEVHEFKSDGISICSKVHPDKCFEEWYSEKITKFNN